MSATDFRPLKSPSSVCFRTFAAAAVLALFPLVTLSPASASQSQRALYTCDGEGDVYYEVEVTWGDGSSTARIGPRSEYLSPAEVARDTETALETPTGSGFRFDSRRFEFFGKGTDARLGFKDYPNEAPYSCTENAGGQTHASGAVGGNETMLGNLRARSLGGKLRNGPGTNFSAAGSLAEGTPVTVTMNTGVRFDGYDWFEIRRGGGVAYQWGGIMCWDGQPIDGMYKACAEVLGARGAATVQSASSGSGFMAFAVSRSGRLGHGAGATRREAERYAMQYCGEASCRIEDVTQARCHAAAIGSSGHWFGAADTRQSAEGFAMGFCTQKGSGCGIEYSFCR